MKCQFCDQELPDGAKFCSKCIKQIVCKECGERLVVDSTICLFCGTEINVRPQMKGMNHIKYNESESGKSFEATFSDETAGNVVETYARFLPPIRKNAEVINNKIMFSEAEEVSIALPSAVEQTKQSNNTTEIDQVFKIRGDNEVYLHETSLKASSKVDYAGRLTLLYLLYQQQHGFEEVKRTEVNNFLERTGIVNDGSYRAWISKNKSLYIISDGNYRLCRTGEERAKDYLKDIFTDEKVDGWKLGDRAKTNTKSGNVKKTQSVSPSYSIIGSLNFNPVKGDSLKDFIEKYSLSNSYEYIVAFVYYLKNNIKEKNIGVNHIYSCYKTLGVKYPTNLRQSVFNTRNRKGWIDTSEINDIKLTASGENAVEHDLKK